MNALWKAVMRVGRCKSVLWPRCLFIFLLATILASPCVAGENSFTSERKQFLAAKKALKARDLPRFNWLAEGLKEYPLYPYLRYAKLRKYIAKVSSNSIQEFLSDYEDTPLAPRLRRAWLRTLAKRGQWQRFLLFYQAPQSTELQCYRLQAELMVGRGPQFWEDAHRLWLVGHSQPDACDRVFDFLYGNRRITNELLWARITLAMDKGKISLAGYLAKRLPARDRDWFELWKQIHKHPSRMLRHPDLKADTQKARAIILHGLQRQARTDVGRAQQSWQTIKGRYSFSKAEVNELKNYLAMRAVYLRHPKAHQWLSELSSKAHTKKSREWRVRTGLAIADWPSTLRGIGALPRQDQQRPAWKYWNARTLEKLNRESKANVLFTELARQRGYFGFLAADRLGWSYSMQQQSIIPNGRLLEKLKRRPAIQRAEELFHLKMMLDARREWFYTTQEMKEAELEQAALLAHEWGWHDRAIITIGQTDHRDDLHLRFPLVYQTQVRRNARHYGLDPAWIMGIMRQESAFMEDARSAAGALGLMQLLPSTGKQTARQLRIPLKNSYSLLQADKNLSIGSGYLSKMRDRFNGNTVMATAAYNAGPHRVALWQPKQKAQPAELWAELIPYTETRNYVRRVLAYTAVFEWRMNRPVTPMRKKMPLVPPKR
ncbi:MAG: transglycosylase SLT domain-containing protein [Gammaproteobacteria bacterium]